MQNRIPQHVLEQAKKESIPTIMGRPLTKSRPPECQELVDKMTEAGLILGELAYVTGIGYPNLSGYLNGRIKITDRTRQRILKGIADVISAMEASDNDAQDPL